jgi:UDPglucose 6-dehydrogenase
MTSPLPRVGVAGLTHLGLVSAAAFAARGLPVVGFDADPGVVEEIGSGRLPVFEPGLAELLAGAQRLRFSAAASDLGACDVVYVALDVATSDDGRSDLGPLATLIESVWPHIDGAATVVVLSQVPPGYTRRLARERASAPRGPAVYYQVETLIFGRAVERAMAPERFMVGCADPAQPLSDAYDRVLRVFGCPVLPMRFESAELAKISINFFLVSSVSTTNLLAEVCERVGADWHEIAPALRLDARIGPKAYLEPGLGIGGGNLGRDLATVKRLSDECGTDTRMIDAWRANSAYRRDWALRVLRHHLYARTPEASLAVWGIAYKQHTQSTKNSPGVALLEALGSRSATVYDPAAELPEHVRGRHAHAADALAACRDADALLIMTPWPQFRDVPLHRVAEAMRGRTLIDPYGVIDAEHAQRLQFDYHRLGLSRTGMQC